MVLLEQDFIQYLEAGFGAALVVQWQRSWAFSNVYFQDSELPPMAVNVSVAEIAVHIVRWGLT